MIIFNAKTVHMLHFNVNTNEAIEPFLAIG